MSTPTDSHNLFVTGIKRSRNDLWLACPDSSQVLVYNLRSASYTQRWSFPYPVVDLCPTEEGVWLLAGGGRLGRRAILWSPDTGEEIRQFNCPDGAAWGLALQRGNLWVPHRHNRKLFCLDRGDGKVRWVIRTDTETFSPSTWKDELWLVECDPGPLGHWSAEEEVRYFFIRFDTARERIVERVSVPFSPTCMTVDDSGFWFAERGREGFRSVSRSSLAHVRA